MTGWPPPGPPRFFGGFAELRRRRWILSAPPEADRGQGLGPRSLRAPAFSTLGFPHDRWALERASPHDALARHRGWLLQVCRDGTPRPRSSTLGTAAGSSRSAVTEQIDWCTKSVSLSHRLGRRRAPDRALLPTCSPSPGSAPPRPIHWTKGLLYTTGLLPQRRPSLTR
jgi:hypothetical protein